MRESGVSSGRGSLRRRVRRRRGWALRAQGGDGFVGGELDGGAGLVDGGSVEGVLVGAAVGAVVGGTGAELAGILSGIGASAGIGCGRVRGLPSSGSGCTCSSSATEWPSPPSQI